MKQIICLLLIFYSISNATIGIDEKLNISIENIIKKHEQKLKSDDIIVSIMKSNTGEIIYLKSKGKAIKYRFEPGSIIKPILVSLVTDKNIVTPDEKIYVHNKGEKDKKGFFPRGSYKIGKYKIKDDIRLKKNYLSIDDIVVYSSNIGTIQLAQRLSAEEFISGFDRFGIAKKTGINLSNELAGVMPEINKFKVGENKGKDNIYKATVSYGQGLTSTFIQILKAYTVFNNDGYIVTPKIVSSLGVLKNNSKEKVISKNSANEMKRRLIKNVKEGTATRTNIEGLEIGGKTGTAQIARNGNYLRKYISSFFGFANDNKNRYTIGVTVINPVNTGKYWYYYYASHSAVPIYKEIVESLLKLKYLNY